MDWEIAKSAIDLIIGNTVQQKQEECSIEFHGGGEPTWNWSVFKSSVDYFQTCANRNGLISKVSLVTNGMLSEKQIEWIIGRNIKTIQISLDGPEEIQNVQRPTIGGGKSFSVVFRTIKSFLARGTEIMLHSVVTKDSVDRIPEIVQFFGYNFPHLMVQIEPACPCGRGLSTGQQFPSPEIFVKRFIESLEIAKSFGIELIYSGAGPQLTETHEGFCGVCEPNFVVTPLGFVTACHEVAEFHHPHADLFIYGHWDKESSRFIFDHQKIKSLKKLSTQRNPLCCECFAQFYCAGECLVKNINEKGKKDISFSDPRCRINRELMKHYIFSRLYGD